MSGPYGYGKRSTSLLDTCDKRLREVFLDAIALMDVKIISGHRGEEEQNALVENGKSQLRFPLSKHNTNPSLAIDAAPYPINWNDRERFTLFAGVILGIAHMRGAELRWGGDWDTDWSVHDNQFDDLAHFELVDESEG